MIRKWICRRLTINFQINELLEQEKNVTIKAFAFDSPGLHITYSSSLYSGGQKSESSQYDLAFY